MSALLHPELKGTDRVAVVCWKCDGAGSLSWGAPVDGVLTDGRGRTRIVPQVCFACNGVGSRGVLVSTLRRQARQEARQIEETARQAAIWEAERPAREAAEAAEAARVAAEKAAAEAAEAARRATLTPVPTGRVTVTGKVVGIKFVDGYRPRSEVKKIVVEDDRGFKVYGTAPEPLWGVERGDRVTFTASVEPSRDDALFGFYKRPTKAATA